MLGRGRGAVIGVVAALAALPAAAAARAPEEFGPLAVNVTRVEIPVPVDPRGPEGVFTTIDADLYVPAGPGGPWPLVHLGHAWPGTLNEFPLSGWGQRLASRGFVVIVADRRGASNLAATPQLNQPSDLVDLSSAVNSDDVLRTLRWAIAQNEVAGSPLHGAVDPERIALAGHSLGGYMATFAAVKSQTAGPHISALLLLDPADERLGQLTYDSSLAVTPELQLPTMVLIATRDQHPVQCNMNSGPDCTLVAPQQYDTLSTATPKLGVQVIDSLHEDVEDPSTIGTPESVAHLRTYQRYGMAWLEYWLDVDCSARPWLGGGPALEEVEAGTIAIEPGATELPPCGSL
jgi:dienelactone hydrolase